MANDAPPKSALIIGASRGIGLGLAKELLTRGWNVTATVRSAKGGSGLEDYYEQVTMETVDINNLSTVDAFVDRMKGNVFDAVIVNAGISTPDGKTVETISPEDVSHLFMTNTISPLRIGTKLLHAVRPGSGILAFMSSILGSIEGNDHGQAPIYGASKSALNQLTRSFAATHKDSNITILSLHPGWVRTEMGGPHADIDVETSVRGLANVLESKASSHVHEFLDYKGETIPW
jgi:NAD(P)-dependent dehydrogenase (short-subunit alcohol dehydrogenase family)